MKRRFLIHTRTAAACLIFAALAGLTAACSSSDPPAARHHTSQADASSSAPAPSTSPMTGAVTPSSAASSTTSIAHPVDLKSVQPCKLFNAAVGSTARTNGDGSPMKVTLPRLPHSPACFQNNGDNNLGLMVVSPLAH